MNFKKLYQKANDQIKADPALVYLAKARAADRPVRRFARIWLPVSAAAVVSLVLCAVLLFHQAAGPAIILKSPSSAAASEAASSADSSSDVPQSSQADSAQSAGTTDSSEPESPADPPAILPLNVIAEAPKLKSYRYQPLSSSFQSGYERFSYNAAATLLSRQEGKNRLISPASLYLATAMLAEAAGGETRQELLTLLEAGSISQLRSQIPQFYENNYFDEKVGELKMTNSIWIKKGYSVRKSALERLAEQYFASSHYADFGTAQAVRELQSWLYENTNGLLGDEIPAAKDEETLFILLNTLYFRDQWEKDFKEDRNVTGDFRLEGGGTAKATYLTRSSGMKVAEGSGYKAIDLKMSHSSMRLVLPDEGVSAMELAASPERLAEIFGKQAEKDYEVDLWLPKFEITAESDLKRDLPLLGVTKAFDRQKADFSSITGDPVFIGEAKQKAKISVDEKGCEAAAYTYYAGKPMGTAPQELPKLTLHFDRPFLFAVMREDSPLFIGVVNTPAAQ